MKCKYCFRTYEFNTRSNKSNLQNTESSKNLFLIFVNSFTIINDFLHILCLLFYMEISKLSFGQFLISFWWSPNFQIIVGFRLSRSMLFTSELFSSRSAVVHDTPNVAACWDWVVTDLALSLLKMVSATKGKKFGEASLHGQ